MAHQRTIVIALDDAGNPLGVEIVEKESDANSETIQEVAESAEANPEPMADQVQHAIDAIAPTSEVEATDAIEAENTPTTPIDDPGHIDESLPSDDASMPMAAPQEPERIEAITVPAPPSKPAYRHRWGKR